MRTFATTDDDLNLQSVSNTKNNDLRAFDLRPETRRPLSKEPQSSLQNLHEELSKMSKDAGGKLIEDLEKNGTSAILITWKTGKNGMIRKGDQVRVQASDSLDNKATAQKLLAVAVELNKHLGILPKDFLDDYMHSDE